MPPVSDDEAYVGWTTTSPTATNTPVTTASANASSSAPQVFRARAQEQQGTMTTQERQVQVSIRNDTLCLRRLTSRSTPSPNTKLKNAGVSAWTYRISTCTKVNLQHALVAHFVHTAPNTSKQRLPASSLPSSTIVSRILTLRAFTSSDVPAVQALYEALSKAAFLNEHSAQQRQHDRNSRQLRISSAHSRSNPNTARTPPSTVSEHVRRRERARNSQSAEHVSKQQQQQFQRRSMPTRNDLPMPSGQARRTVAAMQSRTSPKTASVSAGKRRSMPRLNAPSKSAAQNVRKEKQSQSRAAMPMPRGQGRRMAEELQKRSATKKEPSENSFAAKLIGRPSAAAVASLASRSGVVKSMKARPSGTAVKAASRAVNSQQVHVSKTMPNTVPIVRAQSRIQTQAQRNFDNLTQIPASNKRMRTPSPSENKQSGSPPKRPRVTPDAARSVPVESSVSQQQPHLRSAPQPHRPAREAESNRKLRVIPSAQLRARPMPIQATIAAEATRSTVMPVKRTLDSQLDEAHGNAPGGPSRSQYSPQSSPPSPEPRSQDAPAVAARPELSTVVPIAANPSPTAAAAQAPQAAVASTLLRDEAGIKNLGNTCYMAVIVQMLIKDEQFITLLRERLAQLGDSVSASFSRALLDLADAQHKGITLDPTHLKAELEAWNEEFKGCIQQDAQEFLNVAFNIIEKELGSEFEGCPVTQSFCFVEQKTLTCTSCGKQSEPSFEVGNLLTLGIPTSDDFDSEFDAASSDFEVEEHTARHTSKEIGEQETVEIVEEKVVDACATPSPKSGDSPKLLSPLGAPPLEDPISALVTAAAVALPEAMPAMAGSDLVASAPGISVFDVTDSAAPVSAAIASAAPASAAAAPASPAPVARAPAAPVAAAPIAPAPAVPAPESCHLRTIVGKYFAPETVERKCPNCGANEASMNRTIKGAPRVLYVHLKRFQSSLIAGEIVTDKVNDIVKLPEKIMLIDELDEPFMMLGAPTSRNSSPGGLSCSDNETPRSALAKPAKNGGFFPNRRIGPSSVDKFFAQGQRRGDTSVPELQTPQPPSTSQGINKGKEPANMSMAAETPAAVQKSQKSATQALLEHVSNGRGTIAHRPLSYRLKAVVRHLGVSATSGHYVADILGDDDKWVRYDDNFVWEQDEPLEREQDGYILSFVREE